MLLYFLVIGLVVSLMYDLAKPGSQSWLLDSLFSMISSTVLGELFVYNFPKDSIWAIVASIVGAALSMVFYRRIISQ